MNHRNDHGPYDHMHEPDHDPLVGAALRAIDDPPSAPDFWDRVDERIAEELDRHHRGDGDHRDGHPVPGNEEEHTPMSIELKELNDESLSGSTSGADPGRTSNVVDLGARRARRARRRPLLAAAAAVAILAGGAVVWQQTGSEEVAETTVADARSGPDATGLPDSGEGGGATDASGSDAVPDLPGAVGGTLEVPYASDLAFFDLGDDTVVLAGSAGTDVLLVSRVVDGTEGQGCEGIGGLRSVRAISADGAIEFGGLPRQGVGHAAVGNGIGSFVLTESCEEFVELSSVVSLTGSGNLAVSTPLSRWADVAVSTVGAPVWSGDRTQVLVNALDLDENPVLVRFDGVTGELVDTEPRSEAVIVAAEFGDGTQVFADGEEVRVGESEPVGLGDDDFFRPVRSAVSLDGELVALWGGRWLVVFDSSGAVLTRHEAVGGFHAAAWSPTGHLAFAPADAAQITIERPAEPGSTVTIDYAAGESARWFSLAFADSGQALAASGFSDDGELSRSLRFVGDGPTVLDPDTEFQGGPGIGAVTPEPAAEEPDSTPEVDEAVGITIGDQPLTLRGMGVVQVGMTVAEAEAALGGAIEAFAGLESCTHGGVAGDPSSPRFMILFDEGADFSTGTIARIELLEGQTTLSGIGIGSTKDEVLAAYGDNIVASPHNYTFDQGGEYLTYVPSDGADAQFRLVMETLDDRVTQVRSGLLPAVEWVEGCA